MPQFASKILDSLRFRAKKHLLRWLPVDVFLFVVRIQSLFGSERARERMERQQFFYHAFKALSFNGINGDYAEFGCHGGITFGLAYREAKRHRLRPKMWAFDSFKGLPHTGLDADVHPHWIPGEMRTSQQQFREFCYMNHIPKKRYEMVAGFFNESLPPLRDGDTATNLSLVYIDCDLYSSTKEALSFLQPRLKHGMILAFDDYFCWSKENTSGNRMAIAEAFSNNLNWRLVPFLQFGWHGLSFFVEAKDRKEALQDAI